MDEAGLTGCNVQGRDSCSPYRTPDRDREVGAQGTLSARLLSVEHCEANGRCRARSVVEHCKSMLTWITMDLAKSDGHTCEANVRRRRSPTRAPMSFGPPTLRTFEGSYRGTLEPPKSQLAAPVQTASASQTSLRVKRWECGVSPSIHCSIPSKNITHLHPDWLLLLHLRRAVGKQISSLEAPWYFYKSFIVLLS